MMSAANQDDHLIYRLQTYAHSSYSEALMIDALEMQYLCLASYRRAIVPNLGSINLLVE